MGRKQTISKAMAGTQAKGFGSTAAPNTAMPNEPSPEAIAAAQAKVLKQPTVMTPEAIKAHEEMSTKMDIAEAIANAKAGNIDPEDPYTLEDHLQFWDAMWPHEDPDVFWSQIEGHIGPKYAEPTLEGLPGGILLNPTTPPEPEFELHRNGPQSPEEMSALIKMLRSKGVQEDTLADIESGALPMDRKSRMRRAREMGLETRIPFLRRDVPGRTDLTRVLGSAGSPGRSQNLLYSAPNYRQAQLGNQTGGRAKYDLLFPEGILGLHQGTVTPDMPQLQGDPLENLILGAVDDKMNVGRNMKEGTTGGFYHNQTGDWTDGRPGVGHSNPLLTHYAHALRAMDMASDNSRRAIRQSNAQRRKGFLEANERFREGVFGTPHPNDGPDHLTVDEMMGDNMTEDEMFAALGKELNDEYNSNHQDNYESRIKEMIDDYEGESPVMGLALRNQMMDGPVDADEALNAAHGADDALHFKHVDFGGAEILKNLGYTGTVVNDETGMSVATFYPERVRERKISALDPRYRSSPNIFQSLLAPVGAGAAAAGIGQEER